MHTDVAWLHDLFAPFGAVTVRAMFGGHGIYRDGTIFAIAIDGGLFLKADDVTRARFEAAGSSPYVYETAARSPITMSYWSVPAEALDSPHDLLPWARLAYEAALRKPRRRPPPRDAKARPRQRGLDRGT